MTLRPWPLTLEVMRLWLMRVVVLHPCTKSEVRRPCRTMCISINGSGDLDLWPFYLETGVRVAPKVGNPHSEFRHARSSGSPVSRYVRDGWTDGQNQRLLPAFLRRGIKSELTLCRTLPTSSVEGNDGARQAGDRFRRVSERNVHVVARRRRRRRRVVVSDHAKMIRRTARRRRPIVRRATDDAIGQRDPLADGPVLDDVVVCRTSQPMGVDVRHGVRRRSWLPVQQQTVAVRINGEIVRRRRSF